MPESLPTLIVVSVANFGKRFALEIKKTSFLIQRKNEVYNEWGYNICKQYR